MRRLTRTLALLLVVLPALGALAAGPYRVGLVVSRAGTARPAGAAQALAATAFASRVRAQGGIFGEAMELVLRDDGGDPSRAVLEARTLIEDEGVDALVCCTVPAASSRVAALAEQSGVPLLSPTTLAGRGDAPYWSFSLAPREQDSLAAVVADAQARGLHSLALMTLDNGFGDDAVAALRSLLDIAGMGYAGEARYPPGTTDLRAEGLWIASRAAGAVVVWGLKDDLPTAVDALRRRGWKGPIYARPALLAAAGGGLSLGALEGVRFPVAPIAVADALPANSACREQAQERAAQLRAVYGGVLDLTSAAPVVDALDLLRQGLEQVAALRLGDAAPAQRRQALRDSLVGLGPICGAGGRFDLREGTVATLQPASLVSATVRGGRLALVP
jgi:branched-chain amino acid transport system substrate-binding protein